MSRMFQMIVHRSLAGELTIVMVVKIILLMLAGLFLFGSDHRLAVDENVMTRHIFDQSPSPIAR